MDTSLDSLDPQFWLTAIEFLARTVEARVPVVVTNTRRSADEQAACVARGVSWVKHSKHEAGRALDVCPISIYSGGGATKLDWNPDDPVWERLGALGESVGLVWGGRWSPHRDVSHFEAPDP